jgi:hypothetical protein
MRYSRQNTKFTHQERLAKEDIRLLIDCVELAKEKGEVFASHTRIELLLGKLKRMEKQK